METKHTPTPWKVNLFKHQDGSNIVENRKGLEGPNGEDILGVSEWHNLSAENAALIVRAVNCHEELLKQLKISHGEMLAGGWSHDSLDEVEAIIDKAERK